MRLHECFRNQILIMKLKEGIERFYYKHFSEDEYGVNYENTTHEDRMYHSLFVVIILRFIISSIAFYFIADKYFVTEFYEWWQWVTSIFIGYLFALLVTMIIPKDVVYIPKEKRKLFFKGSYTPIPLTFVWILPKFL